MSVQDGDLTTAARAYVIHPFIYFKIFFVERVAESEGETDYNGQHWARLGSGASCVSAL